MGMSWLVLLETCKYVGRKYRKLVFVRAIGPLAVTIISIAIVNIWDLYKPENGGIFVIGDIPSGLPGECFQFIACLGTG